MRKIVFDVFGSDDPRALLQGIADAARQIPDVTFVVAGDRAVLTRRLGTCLDRVEMISASSVITNNEEVAQAIVAKRDSSVVKALTALKEDDETVGMIAAGNTGALLVGSAIYLGRLPGVVRPALASLLPTATGGYVCLLDCGANVDCTPEQLPAFAVMGAALMRSRGVSDPGVALLSVGSEPGKGDAFTRAAYPLLKAAPVRFYGNIEAGVLLSGQVDVAVCGGFAGNLLLKGVEGAAKFAVQVMVDALKKHLPADTDPRVLRAAVADAMQSMDYTNKAGAVLLGVKKPIIKIHGAATAETVPNAVRQMLALADSGFTEQVEAALQ